MSFADQHERDSVKFACTSTKRHPLGRPPTVPYDALQPPATRPRLKMLEGCVFPLEKMKFSKGLFCLGRGFFLNFANGAKQVPFSIGPPPTQAQMEATAAADAEERLFVSWTTYTQVSADKTDLNGCLLTGKPFSNMKAECLKKDFDEGKQRIVAHVAQGRELKLKKCPYGHLATGVTEGVVDNGFFTDLQPNFFIKGTKASTCSDLQVYVTDETECADKISKNAILLIATDNLLPVLPFVPAHLTSLAIVRDCEGFVLPQVAALPVLAKGLRTIPKGTPPFIGAAPNSRTRRSVSSPTSPSKGWGKPFREHIRTWRTHTQ